MNSNIKKKIKRKIKKLERRFRKFEPDTQAIRNYVLVFMICFFILADVAIWQSNENYKKSYNVVVYKYQSRLEKNAKDLTRDHPMEVMLPYIVKRDKQTASFVLAIANKESNLGLYSPKKDGKDCFNYWGYRGQYNKTKSGYSCFDSPEQAVAVIGDRIKNLIEQDLDTPQELAVWKCGYDCSWDNPRDVQKWVKDVDYFYRKFNE